MVCFSLWMKVPASFCAAFPFGLITISYKRTCTDILNQDRIKFHASSHPVFQYVGIWQDSPAATVRGCLCSDFAAQDPLSCELSLLPAFLWQISDEPVMPRKGVRHSSESCLGEKEPALPSWAASLPQLPCLSLPLQHIPSPSERKSSVSLGGMIQFHLETRGLCRPCGRAWQGPHLTAPAAPWPARCVPPTGPATAGSVRLGLQPPVTSHQLQSHLQTQVVFALPLEKKAFLCETVDNTKTDHCLQVI